MKAGMIFKAFMMCFLLLLMFCTLPSTVQAGLQAVQSLTIVVTNTTFRLQYAVPDNTFTDKDYKSVKDLTMYLYAHNGEVLPKKSWIFLTAQTINLYSTKNIYSQQPSEGYKFRLSAIDLFGHDNYTTLIVKFTGPTTEPNYLRTINITSDTGVFVKSFNDARILFTLQSIMAPYLGVDTNDIVNDLVSITRSGTTFLTMDYTFSTRYLIGSTCNTSAIIQLREKLVGSIAEQNFKSALQPQFSVISMAGETFQKGCSSISSAAPVVGSSFGTQSIQVGHYFSLVVSSSLFLSPAGSNMRLKLYLRLQDNTVIPTNYWIGLNGEYLDQNINIRGVASLKVASTQSSYSFKLVAVSPILVETSQNVQFNLQKSFSNILVTVTFTHNSVITTSYLTLVSSFVSYMSSYLGVSSSAIIFIDFQTTSVSSVMWTISSLLKNPCDLNEVNNLRLKLMETDGSVKRSLQTGLSTAIGFAPSVVNIKLSGSCDLPRVTFKIPTLYLPKYGSLSYIVPHNAFTDGIDGNNLMLYLLDVNGNNLAQDSWIWFNNETRTIDGFPTTVSSTSEEYFILRAFDSDEASVDQNLTVIRNWTQPAYTLSYEITFTYDSKILPLANMYTTFLTKLKVYFKWQSSEDVILFQISRLANSKIILHFQKTSLRTDICDVKANDQIISMLKKSHLLSIPNPAFNASMQPYFNILKTQEFAYGKCQILNRKPPEFMAVYPAVLVFFLYPRQIPYCKATVLLIPENSFHDEEEGNTRNLKLNLTDDNEQMLPIDSWVNFNTTTQTIYAIADDNTYAKLVGSSYKYLLTATDSDGKSVAAPLTFTLSGPPPPGYYNITMHFDVSKVNNVPYPIQLSSLYVWLANLLQNGLTVHTHSYNVIGNTAKWVWTPCNMAVGLCNLTTIAHIRSKLFSAGTSTLNPGIKSLFAENNILSTISESLGANCIEEPPSVMQQIPDLFIGFCGEFTYNIPANTFKDKEDGNTTQLKLQLVHSNGAAMNTGFWLHFDSSLQQIRVVLTQEQASPTYQKDHSFLLVATDASNLASNTTIRVCINGTFQRYSHTFTLQTIYSVSSSSDLLYMFVKKLGSFLAVNKKSLQVVSQTEAAGKKLIITWSNCLLRYDPCDVMEIKKVRDKLQTSAGDLRSEFKQAMNPEFDQLFLTETNVGPCTRDQPPTVKVPFGPIYVTTCLTYKQILPADTFNDNEQGNTRNLDVKMKSNSNYWIGFDSTKQELSILATNQIATSLVANSVTITLTATDLNLQEVQHNVIITIFPQSKNATQKVTMQYRITALPQSESFVSLYDTMRANIVKHFNGASSTLSSVEFSALPEALTLNTVMNAEWSSCSTKRDTCDKTGLNTISEMVMTGSSVNTAFKTALQANFNVISATATPQGLCKDQITAPVVHNSLPIIDISYCGYKVFQVPANTFYDAVDGNTRQLTLTVLNATNQPADDKWLYFEPKSQTFRIVLSDDSLPILPTPRIISYTLKATTKRGLSITDNLRFRLSEQHPNVSFVIKMNFAWIASNPPARNVILTTIVDRFIAYFNGFSNDIHFVDIQELVSSYPYFVLKIANCSARYSPCDKATMDAISPRINDKQGTVEAFKVAMGKSDVYITYVQVTELGPCLTTNSAPTVKNPLGKIQVSTCSDFNYTLPSNTFRDEEDSVLQLSVTKINGLPISGNYRWVRIFSTDRLLVGVITDRLIPSQPAKGYNLTIRATDSGGLFAETHFIVQIVGERPQHLYQFSMQLSTVTIGEQFQEEREIIRLLNSYFKSKFTNIISYSHAGVAANNLIVRSSICVLPNKCDEAAALNYFNKIKTKQNTIPTELSSYLSSRYTIVTTNVHRASFCQQPLNPPVPALSTWTIQGSYCGGLNVQIPKSMFSDPEDGDTRALTLELYLNTRTALPSTYWVQLNKTSQVIYGNPTRAETLNYNSSVIITLVAKDRTGQEGSVSVKFSFKTHSEPKYLYKLVYQTVRSYTKLIDEIRDFSSLLQQYLHDSSSTSLGLIGHSEHVSGSHFFDFTNCSVLHNPCDVAALSTVKNRLLTSSNLPLQELKDAMQPFSISYGQVHTLPPCTGAANHPPTISVRITILNISICSMFSFVIPANTFYDTEDGNTRKLILSLADNNNNALSSNFWMQLDSATQTITAQATATLALAQPTSGYSFILTATDSTKLSASNSFKAKLIGPAQILKDCQIQILFTTTTASSSSNNVLIQTVMTGLRSYFSLNATEIGLVNFIRHTSSQFTFSWSYCSSSYSHSSVTSSQHMTVDYKGLVVKVLLLLFQSDRKTVQTAFYSAFSGLTVVSVKNAFAGACQNIPPIIPTLSKLSLSVDNCGYRKEAIQSSWFYDFEDGNTFNLKLTFLNSQNITVGVQSWANLDIITKNLLMSLRDSERLSSQTNFLFYLKATDAASKSAILPVSIQKLGSTTTKSPFTFTFEYTIAKFHSNEIYVNESIILSEVTAQLYSLSNGKNVITSQYTAQSAPHDTRSFKWSPCNYQACGTSTALQKTKGLFVASTGVLTTFRNTYLPKFTFQRAYYISSCGVPGLPPSTTASQLEFNITMCSPFIYKIPNPTFVDSIDGETQNMHIRLLDNNKKPLQTNSWMQLNTATLEIYAIYQSSFLSSRSSVTSQTSTNSLNSIPIAKSVSFYLEATNSRGLQAYQQVKANILNYPYTSDCYISMTVIRTFGSTQLAELDVLYRLVNAISHYYQDISNRIKVYKFQKTSSFSYSLTFSNCSFVFSTMKAAKYGLDESHRIAITSIFSRMMHDNGTAKSAFASFLASRGFRLQNIGASYSCIEAPPFSKVSMLRTYAFLCREYNDPLADDLFSDTRDGTNFQLSLRYTNGEVVSPNEWVQLDPVRKAIYGVVTMTVKRNIPGFAGYRYLLVATDSSGRTANVSYTIKIASAAPIKDIRFFLGFRSIFNEFSKTADILTNVTRKLSTLIDNNNLGKDIVIHKYDAINFISFEHCTLACTPTATTSVLQKLQKVVNKPLPSDALKAALGPEITPYYIYAEGPNCGVTSTVTIIVSYVMVVNQPICGTIEYIIPANVFSNSLGETTRDFLLSLKTGSGLAISRSSIIQFHQGLQEIHGIVVVSQASQSMSYQLTASSSRSKATSTTTNVQVNFSGLASFKKIESRLCVVTVSFMTYYNPDITDVWILRTFSSRVARLFNSNSQQIQIISYSRSVTFPSTFTVSFANCSWSYLLQSSTKLGTYYQRVETTLRSLFQYSGSSVIGASQALVQVLKPDFILINIVQNTTTCSQPPDKPPVPRPLDPIMAPECGEFNYQIPADLFTDEAGNTRVLQVEVLQNDGNVMPYNSWIVFDNVTQTISGLPLNKTLIDQPTNGYSYKVKATDKSGLSAFATLVIKINGKPYKRYNDVQLHLTYKSTIKSKFEMSHILAFTRKIASYIGMPNYFRVMSSTVSSGRISMQLVDCISCNPAANVGFYYVNNTKQIFNIHMSPEFPQSFNLEAPGFCSSGPEIVYNITGGMVRNVSFCTRTRHNYLQLNGIPQPLPDIKFILRDANTHQLPTNSWFWFNETSSTLEAFPSEAVWRSQPIDGTPFTWTIEMISTGQQGGMFQKDTLRITGVPPTSGLQYTITFSTTLSPTVIDAYVLTVLFDSLSSYLNRQDLQHVSITRQQGGTLPFTVKFLICGLNSDCSSPAVKTLENKIFQSPGVLQSEFTTIFPSFITVSSVSDNCRDNPPDILLKNLNITVPVCGLYRYKIPAGFARDQEDGDADNLSISLRLPGHSIIPREYWLRFNESSHEIYALPPESVARTPQTTGWKFIIIVKDKGGKQVETTLNVYVEQDKTVYYKQSLSFKTVNMIPSTPYLDIQMKFLTMISAYFFDSSLSQYRVLSFSKTGNNGPKSEAFFMQFGNCSVASTVCSSIVKSITTMQQVISSNYLNPNSQFSRYMATSFVVTSVKNESLYKIDKPPKVLNIISTVRIDMCGMFIGNVPSGTFYDEEQGTSLQMILRFQNGTKPDSNYWMQSINKKLYIVPYGSTMSGTYSMLLTVSDRCGQTTSTTITTILTDNTPSPQYQFNMEARAMTSMPGAYYVSKLKDALKSSTSDVAYQTRVTMYLRNNDMLYLRWANCSILCDQQAISKLKQNIFLAYDVIKPSFRSRLEPYFNVLNITEIHSKDCNVPPSLPPVANRSLSIQVPLCSKISFIVPADTFYDPEDGNTRKLTLSLLTESKQAVSQQSWVQLDQTKQILYGYPRMNGNLPYQRVYRYLLAANDKEGNSASTTLTVTIIGDIPDITYKMTITGETALTQSVPDVAQEIVLINKIGSYFNDYAINDIAFLQTSKTFQFSWSFCSMRTDVCDCYRIQQIRSKLSKLHQMSQILKPDFTMTNYVTGQMLKVCANTHKPELLIDRNDLTVQSGQYFSYVIRNDKFYDLEDGYTRNLTIYMANSNSVKLNSSYWFRVEDYQICGLLSLVQAEQTGLSVNSTREYKTMARDRCGKETGDSFIVRVNNDVRTLDYRITVYLRGSIGENCTKINTFIQKISSYVKTPVSNIYVQNYETYNATQNSSLVTWGLRSLTEKNCRNETIKVVREKFFSDKENANSAFVQYMQPQYEVISVRDERSHACANGTILIPPPTKADFPWWILILILILALFFLLCWLCWLCIPRCCPGCCLRCCGGICGKCCTPGGKYASLDEEGVAGMPKGPEDEKTGGKDGDGEEDETMLFPPPYLIPDDPNGKNLGFENDGLSDEDAPIGNVEPPKDNGGKLDEAEEDSSGFREELDDRSDYDARAESLDSGVLENEIVQENIQLAEAAPSTPGDIMVPPLYSAGKTERQANVKDDDFFADMLGEARRESEDSGMFQAFGAENDRSEEGSMEERMANDRLDSGGIGMQSRQRNGEQGTGEMMAHDRFNDGRMAMQSRQIDDYENFDRNDKENRTAQISGIDLFESSTDYDNNYNLPNADELEMKKETTSVSKSFYQEIRDSSSGQAQDTQDASLRQSLSQYPNLPVPGGQTPLPRQLPVPNIPYMNQMTGAENNGFNQDDSFSSYRETRRSPRETRRSSINDMTEMKEIAGGQQALVLPSPGIRRVSVTRPVELSLPRSTFEALQSQNSEEIEMYSEGRMAQQRIIPVVLDSPNGEVFKEIRFTEGSSRRISDLSSVRRSFSESNLLDMDQGAIANRQTGADQHLGYPGYDVAATRRDFATSDGGIQQNYTRQEFRDGDAENGGFYESYRNEPSNVLRTSIVTQETIRGSGTSRTNGNVAFTSNSQLQLPSTGAGRAGPRRSSLQALEDIGRAKGFNNPSHSQDYAFESDSVVSDFGPRFMGTNSNQTVINSRSRRNSRSGRPGRVKTGRRRSKVTTTTTRSTVPVDRYEMRSRTVGNNFSNRAYDSDSFV